MSIFAPWIAHLCFQSLRCPLMQMRKRLTRFQGCPGLLARKRRAIFSYWMAKFGVVHWHPPLKYLGFPDTSGAMTRWENAPRLVWCGDIPSLEYHFRWFLGVKSGHLRKCMTSTNQTHETILPAAKVRQVSTMFYSVCLLLFIWTEYSELTAVVILFAGPNLHLHLVACHVVADRVRICLFWTNFVYL